MSQPPAGGGGFSLSLGGVARKPGVRPAAAAGDRGGASGSGPVREEVLGFGADGGLRTAAPAAAARGPLVIAPQENSYK